jgi:hypothetical protein
MILARNLEQTRKRRRVCLHAMSYFLRNVLVDQQDGYVLALSRELVECGLDGACFGLGVYDEEVLRGFGRGGDMLRRC